MSASSDSSRTDIDTAPQDSNKPPLISALFLIKFDQKIGYTLAWKRSSVDVDLEGVVEYKSLPSGLHTVKEDLVYFVHEDYAGISAFISAPAEEADRNAHFVAVGALVPLSYGRLGRSWLHAQSLQQLARVLVEDTSKVAPLEEFWELHRSHQSNSSKRKSSEQSDGSGQPSSQSRGHNRDRALSSVTAVLPSEQSLSSWHPALSILNYIDTLGPLIFPLQRAALLRKRILFITSPPVRRTCEYVYDLSILSSMPASVLDLLSPGSDAFHRLPALFTLGVHDIPLLEKLGASTSEEESDGWVACTTDEIIKSKSKLYDIIVEMPPQYEHAPEIRQWPKITTAQGSQIKASQRDLRRFKLLHHELWKIRAGTAAKPLDEDQNDDDEAPLLSHDADSDEDQNNDGYDDRHLIEPMSWSQLAYSGFMWWASAGEKDAYLAEEQQRDREMLGDLSDFLPHNMRSQGTDVVQAGLHTAIIAYFHRLTSLIVTTLSEIVETADDEGEEDEQAVTVDREDIARLGLDAWNESDKQFIADFLGMYFGRRRAHVHGAHLECCGIKIG